METTFDNDRLPQKKRRPRYSHERSVDSLASFTLTPHAELRAAQRGLTRRELGYVVRHGHPEHTCEAVIYFLRAIDIPDDDRRHMKRLEGTAVIMTPDQSRITTIWRNKLHGGRNIHRKQARVWRKKRLTGVPDVSELVEIDDLP